MLYVIRKDSNVLRMSRSQEVIRTYLQANKLRVYGLHVKLLPHNTGKLVSLDVHVAE